ncbi:hypothetical protein PGS49_22730 [Yersinia intermedia]|uniref:hypothetical protein n=1 Tax=Yersinia intermedia TaxID=631 RepID=UPI0022FF45C2|nr:hypothetical protein [Yersinia intermedia]MDA5483413.1 hypothetical protein [Yersinia intermedia]
MGTPPLSSDETLVYVPVVPGIYTDVYPGVNNYYWNPAASTPFPTTAALGLRFTYYLGDGIQGNFTFSTNQPSWTSVDAAGVVTITAAPTSATKTVTITATQIAAPHAVQSYTFTVNKWFDVATTAGIPEPVVNNSPMSYANQACAVLGSGWQGAGFQNDIRGAGPASAFRRVPGALMAEWGSRMTPQGWGGGSGLSRLGYLYAPTVGGNAGLEGTNPSWYGLTDWDGINGLFPLAFNPSIGSQEASISPDGYAKVASGFGRVAYMLRLVFPQTGNLDAVSIPYIACVKGV